MWECPKEHTSGFGRVKRGVCERVSSFKAGGKKETKLQIEMIFFYENKLRVVL